MEKSLEVRLRSTYGAGSHGAWAQLPLGMWDLRSPTRYQTQVPGIGKHIKYWMTRVDDKGTPAILSTARFSHVMTTGWNP